MRLLLIHPVDFDLQPLLALCSKHEVDTVPAGTPNFGLKNGPTAYRALILAGPVTAGKDSWEAQDKAVVSSLHDILQGEAGAVADKTRQQAVLPVIGLGWGFTMVCAALGEDLYELAERDVAATTVRPTDDGAKLFQGTEPIKVAEGTRWAIDQLPRSLRVLAMSESGIEAVKHNKMPLLALQMLPEDFVYPSDGKLVFENALSIAVRA